MIRVYFAEYCLVIGLVIIGLCFSGCSDNSQVNGPEEDMPLPHVVTTTETGIQITTSVGTTHELVLVPEGPFAMGANNGIRNEGPEHTVSLKAYYIDRTEISNAQWNAYAIAEHVRPNLNTPDHPVVNVSWFNADEYCKWLGGRLPTEAEWEKAARGTDGRIYPWGMDRDSERANHLDSGDPFDNGTSPVDYYGEGNRDGRSPYGVLGMAGNVWEWVQDEYDSTFYQRSPESNPVNYELKTHFLHLERVVRGGSWFSPAFLIRTTARAPKSQSSDRYVGVSVRGRSVIYWLKRT